MTGFPAARIGDMHVCPLVNGVVPHVGGPILPPCAPAVITCGVPQARISDMLTCVGPPDVIVSGAATVLVAGLPAARITDQTAHGGKIVVGCPTVIIGGPQLVKRGNVTIVIDRVNKTITITGIQEYSGTGASQTYVVAATNQINNTWSGPTQFEGQNYQVNCQITGQLLAPGGTPTPGTTQINVVQTTSPLSVTSRTDPSNQPFYSTSPGYQHSTDPAGPGLTVAHEFGHTMGLPDEYTETRNPDGTRTTTPNTPGGLMGDVTPGSRPTPGNFNSLATGNGLAPQ